MRLQMDTAVSDGIASPKNFGQFVRKVTDHGVMQLRDTPESKVTQALQQVLTPKDKTFTSQSKSTRALLRMLMQKEEKLYQKPTVQTSEAEVLR